MLRLFLSTIPRFSAAAEAPLRGAALRGFVASVLLLWVGTTSANGQESPEHRKFSPEFKTFVRNVVESSATATPPPRCSVSHRQGSPDRLRPQPEEARNTAARNTAARARAVWGLEQKPAPTNPANTTGPLTPEFRRFVGNIVGDTGLAASPSSTPPRPTTGGPKPAAGLSPAFLRFVSNVAQPENLIGVVDPRHASPGDSSVLDAPPETAEASHDAEGIAWETQTSRWSDHLQHIPPTIGGRSNQQADGACLLEEYQNVIDADQSPERRKLVGQVAPGPLTAWWDNLIRNNLGLASNSLNIGVPSLIQGALAHSPQIQVAAAVPQIQKTFLVEESAAFDWQSFVETRYDDDNDPIGNSLTTGNNADRFLQQEWYARGGGRRRLRGGGDLEIAQRVGTFTNNSRFLVPANQGNSRLELTFTQPLLNGRGRLINESLIVLARIDSSAASDRFVDDLQAHLILITEAYWELHRARATYLQRVRLLTGAQRILESLRARSEIDALDRQILRASSAVAARHSEIARARADIRNAESQLRLLVGDPALIEAQDTEFMPLDTPYMGELPITISDAVTTALSHRPDISEAIRDLRSAAVRTGLAKNDLLPQLNLQIASYVAGLAGQNRIGKSLGDQFANGRPGFGFGIEYALPVGNRAARARLERRKWQQLEAANRFEVIVREGMTEVEIAVREIETTRLEMTARYEAMTAASNETAFLVDRWRTLPNLEDSAVLLLENLLDSQERLADEESAFVQAQANYAVATVRLRQAMGTLLQMHRFE